jgi:PST family polysaccharide transporter
MHKRLFGSVLALGFIQIINYVAPFVVLGHLTRTLGLDLYGVVAFGQGVILLCGVIIDFGFGLSATNKISKNRHNKPYVGKLIAGVLCVKIILYLTCAIVVVIYSSFTERYGEHSAFINLCLLPILVQSMFPIWFFQGLEKIKYAAISMVLSKILYALMVVLFIDIPEHYYLIPILSGATDFFGLIISAWFVHALGFKMRAPSIGVMRYCFNFSKKFFSSRVAVAAYTNSAVVLLGLTTQPSIVAAYSMAEQLYKAMQGAISPAAAAAYPYMANEKDYPLMVKLFVGVVLVSIIGGCAGYQLAPAILLMAFDGSWLVALPILNIFFFGIVVHAAAIMSGYPLAALVDRLDVANSSVFTGAIIFLLLAAMAYALDKSTPIVFALIMLSSEFAVFVHRIFILVPVAMKEYQITKKREGI